MSVLSSHNSGLNECLHKALDWAPSQQNSVERQRGIFYEDFVLALCLINSNFHTSLHNDTKQKKMFINLNLKKQILKVFKRFLLKNRNFWGIQIFEQNLRFCNTVLWAQPSEVWMEGQWVRACMMTSARFTRGRSADDNIFAKRSPITQKFRRRNSRLDFCTEARNRF